MTTKDQISQRFEKWDSKNWLNIEKEINTFQKKVAQNMLALGSFDYNPENIKPCLDDECVLGQQIYIQIVRPKLVKLEFLPKEKKVKIEKKKIGSDDDSEEEEEIPKEAVKGSTNNKKQAKKVKAKKEKAPKIKKQELMKQQIVRDNFSKQIEFVFQSFSMEKMQIQFGFKQKKLELKMSTFFYIACFIRKNRVKHQLDQSQVFQLINILIKAHRIFKDYQGKSFLDSSATIQISAKFIQDLKDCLDALMQYYNYSIKQVITKYPKLVYYTIYDQYFPTLDIKPYKSQIEFADSVRNALVNNKSTLIFYKTMIGSGKTSASISIANMIRELKMMDDKKYKNLQLIYCCIIKSVRSQVGKLAYNQKIKFALGTMDTIKNLKNLNTEGMSANQKSNFDSELGKVKSELEYFPRIVNSFSCRDEKIVDLIISDLYTTKEFFADNKLPNTIASRLRQQGRLERENVVLFLDQPTAFCSEDSTVTKKLFEIISQYPPKIIIFASATMPESDQLQKMINLVKLKNPDIQVKQIKSKQFQIGCQFCTFQGDIIYPHSNLKTKQKLIEIIHLIEKNPFLMRLYTGPSLFALLDKCKKAGLKKGLPKLQSFLEIRQTDILRETLNILNELKNHPDEVIEEVCKVDKQLMNINYEEKEEEDEIQIEKKKERYVNIKKLLKSDAHKFLGGCLIATQDPVNFAKTLFETWIQDIPSIKKLLDRYQKDHRLLEEKLEGIQEDKNMRADQKMKKKSQAINEFEPKFDFPDIKRINTSAHYNKYCKNKNPIHTSMLIKPIIVQNIGIELFSEVEDWMIKLLFCGIAVYSKYEQSSFYLNKVQQLASSNFLAYIICDESLCYGTNFPISNVILRDDLASKLSMNEMFQLIGRAGRVGQSWTARAFLEKKGVIMLQEYILNQEENKLTPQSDIFERFATKILDNPKLELKSERFQIKAIQQDEKQTKIEIRIRKNQNQKDIIRQLIGVIYRFSQQNKFEIFTGTFEVDKNKNLNIYKVFSDYILQEDLPKRKIITATEVQKSILDIQYFYKDDKSFVQKTLNNAIRRIINTQFNQKIQITNINNAFDLNTYDRFFVPLTKSYTFYIQVESSSNVFNNKQYLEYQFRSIEAKEKIQTYATDKVLQDARNILAKNEPFFDRLNQNAKSALNEYDLNPIKEQHSLLISANVAYKNLFEYQRMKFKDKNLSQDHQLFLALKNNIDFVNIQDRLFQVDSRIRSIWAKVEQNAKSFK